MSSSPSSKVWFLTGASRGLGRDLAKAVLASLWDVDDESTGRLMADFYRRWISGSGLTKAEALQQAQLDLLRGTAANNPQPGSAAESGSPYAHPYYWAPFILIGNWK